MDNKTKLLIMLLLLSLNFPLFSGKEGVRIDIKPGTDAGKTADLLMKNRIIESRTLFILFLKLSLSTKRIKAGSYFFYEGESYGKIRNKLINGSDYYIKVTIPEGFTLEQIAKRFEKNGIIKSAAGFTELALASSMRGYLFPDTYKFFPDEDPEKVIEIMKSEFERRFSQPYRADIEKHDLGLEKLVIMASLVEKEAKVAAERPVIAAIFRLRMKKLKYLESCASVLFALGKHKEKLTYKDLEVDSPYNTYKNFGLPPTAICSPGLDSLKAALHPAITEYMYFFSKGDGYHEFSVDYKGHLKKQKTFTRK